MPPLGNLIAVFLLLAKTLQTSLADARLAPLLWGDQLEYLLGKSGMKAPAFLCLGEMATPIVSTTEWTLAWRDGFVRHWAHSLERNILAISFLDAIRFIQLHH
ncbi:hypothetical protein ADS79_17510 [Brevibacillus reuszeri]|uniref:Uncharacterized protein n=1 Tax=Brevibacillus reuszeri TaxID=54915 RepID=A0A0K9YPN5_9BACL|nr:hypothetical protein ADS79_17510 [Brevibacillus reuszeri]